MALQADPPNPIPVVSSCMLCLVRLKVDSVGLGAVLGKTLVDSVGLGMLWLVNTAKLFEPRTIYP